MHFLSDIVREFSLCPYCGAELLINVMESLKITTETDLSVTLDSKCVDCEHKWSHMFTIDFTEKE